MLPKELHCASPRGEGGETPQASDLVNMWMSLQNRQIPARAPKSAFVLES